MAKVTLSLVNPCPVSDRGLDGGGAAILQQLQRQRMLGICSDAAVSTPAALLVMSPPKHTQAEVLNVHLVGLLLLLLLLLLQPHAQMAD